MTGACTINDDGTMIAIPHWNSNNNRIAISIHNNTNGTWKQMGSIIEGDENDYFGARTSSISFDSSGYRIAIGAIILTVVVLIYLIGMKTDEWENVVTIRGTENNMQFGYSVSMIPMEL